MLKKAGIVVATAAAGLLAVSPLAFAGDYESDNDHHDNDHHHSRNHHASCSQDNSVKNRGHRGGGGLVSVTGNTVQVPIQACNNSVVEGVLGILAKNQKNDDSHGDNDD